MSIISTERKNLSLNKFCIKDQISDWIEQDIIVPDNKPDAIKIVSVTVNSYVKDSEVLDDKIKIEGKLCYYVIYKCNDENMSVRGLCATFPYSQTLALKGAKKDMNAYVKSCVRNVIYSLPNERKVATKTEVVFNVKIKSPVSVSLINKFKSDDDDIECKTKTEKFNNITADKVNVIASKEDIMLPKENEDFVEILKVVPTINKLEYKESFNKVMVKGDIIIALVYLSSNKDNPVRNANLEMPFTGMVEVDGINDKSQFDIRYSMQDFNIALNSEITTSKTLTANYQIGVNVEMFEPEELEYIDDFYSQTRELKYNSEILDVTKTNVKASRNIDLKDNISNILSDTVKLVSYDLDTSYISSRVVGNTVHIDGNAKLVLLLLNNNELESRTEDILVNDEYTLEDITKDSNVDVDINTADLSVSPNGNDLEIKSNLKADINIDNVAKVSVINDIDADRLDLTNLDSMNIYIVKANDTLWNIAKKYKTSIEKIVKTNDIEDPEKIDIGQKVLIIR